MPAEQALKGTNDLVFRAVECESVNRCPSGGSNARQLIASPAEMVIPLLVPRMKQSN